MERNLDRIFAPRLVPWQGRNGPNFRHWYLVDIRGGRHALQLCCLLSNHVSVSVEQLTSTKD